MGVTKSVKHGRGSVWQARNKKGQLLRDTWRYCDSWTDMAGERHRVSGTHHGTKSEAFAAMEEKKRLRQEGIRLDGSQVTFSEFAAEWQETREESGELSWRTLDESARHVRVISNYIGARALTDINAEIIERFLYKDLLRDKRKPDGSTITQRTLLDYYRCLNQIMQKACNYDYILRNPCLKVRTPKPADVERRALSDKDARRLLAELEREEAKERAAFETKEQRQVAWKADKGRGAIRGLHSMSNIIGVRIGLVTGMRLGEVMGLTWGAVDLTSGCLHVRQSLTQHGEIKPPKTAAGRRTIWLDRATVAHLAEWKRFQTAQLRKIGKVAKDKPLPGSVPVVCSDIGGYTNLNNYGAWWRSWRESHGFSGLKFHELRHTQATQLLANGVDVKTVQTRLGHTDPALTLKWYAHSVEENDRQAAALIGGLLASCEAQ